MKPPRLSTPISIESTDFRLPLGSSIYALGSCFAQHMGERLSGGLFPTTVNPMGVLYNPISVATGLTSKTQDPDLLLHQGRWRSLHHHSSLSASEPEQALQRILTAESDKTRALQQSQFLLLTLGTSQTFALSNSGLVVANCHRLPQSLFCRRRLTPHECVEALFHPLEHWLGAEGKRRVILTVSPVRYLRDGAVENSRGKAALLLAAEMLEDLLPGLHYFPAYEIVLDELRDYRYFERDMTHPTELAVDIVWQRFAQTYLDDDSLTAMAEIDRLRAALAHRSEPGTDQSALGRKSLLRLERLAIKHPGLDLEPWRAQFLMLLQSEKTPE